MPQFNIADIDTTIPNISIAAGAPDIESLVRTTARKHGLDPDLMSRIAKQESNFQPAAVSPKGATGVMQLMPSTAAALQVDPTNIHQNIEGGARYFKQMLDRFGGDTRKALAAYNWGPENVAAGKLWPKETTDYVNKIAPQAATGRGQQFNISDIEQGESGTPQLSQAPPIVPAPTVFDYLKSSAGSAADAVKPFVPDIVGGITTALAAETGPFAPVLGAAAAALARGGEQAGLVQSGQQSREGALQSVRNTAISNLAAGLGGEALSTIAPAAAKWTYAKLLGIIPQDARGAQAITDMLERRIPLGAGFWARVGKLKDKANAALNEIYKKYAPTQTPGLVRVGVAGETAAQQGAQQVGNVVNKTDIINDVAKHYMHDPTIPRNEIDAAASAIDTFMGRMGNDISLADARAIKQNLQLKPDYAARTEGMMQARKVIAHAITEHIAKAIPNAADRAAFINASSELERLINIEELPGVAGAARKVMSGQIAMPIAGGLVGYTSSYYTHQDPAAAALRGAVFGGLTGQTLPSTVAIMASRPLFQKAVTAPFRAVGQQPAAPQLTQEDQDRLLKFLQSSQGSPQ